MVLSLGSLSCPGWGNEIRYSLVRGGAYNIRNRALPPAAQPAPTDHPLPTADWPMQTIEPIAPPPQDLSHTGECP